MKFNLNKSLEILTRTPDVLNSLLSNLSDDWTKNSEGGDSWSPYDIIGHLIHGEKTDWIARAKIILSETGNKKFEPYDRFAQFKDSKGKTLSQLLDEFSDLRKENIKTLNSFGIDEEKLKMEGIHPNFGTVTLKGLLSTWVIHDLTHIAQISRVMAKQYKDEMGPWIEYVRLMKE
jgi:DinB superfamily